MQARIAEKAAVQSLLSGRVGGNVASRVLSAHLNEPDLVCVDMGGTSFDVSLVVDGKGESLNERELGGNPILAPMIDIHTIGAGGGSVAWDDQGTLRVGPRSAGATPGPACYGRGGEEATVTDEIRCSAAYVPVLNLVVQSGWPRHRRARRSSVLAPDLTWTRKPWLRACWP